MLGEICQAWATPWQAGGKYPPGDITVPPQIRCKAAARGMATPERPCARGRYGNARDHSCTPVDISVGISKSRSVSRVLYHLTMVAVIHLGRMSPYGSSDLPGDWRGPRPAARSGLSPYLVLLRVGFALPPALTGAVRSYRTFSPLPACP